MLKDLMTLLSFQFLEGVIKHNIVHLTSYPWKQSRILCHACCLKGATAYGFMTDSAGVRNQSLIVFLHSVNTSTTPHIPNKNDT